ncbi:MAG: homocysteine biosynthesis protein, partial [Candidatus Bathyarchaeota archaeon]
RAISYGTDCYPRTKLDTTITKDDLNQFYLLNFRNCYQRYVCATNSRDEIIYTYMGKLLPRHRNATYSGAGSLNPLMNDPDYETIGIGTRIFLGGGQGYVLGEGTQHDPCSRFGTIMVRGDCKQMSPEFISGGAFTKYGTSLYIGMGIPIPILNKGLAKKTSIRDEEILTNIIDYGVPRRGRPKLGTVSYATLKSGEVTINDRKVKVSSMSSLKKAKKIAGILKSWIENGTFYLSAPSETLPTNSVCNPMKQSDEITFVSSVAQTAVTCRVDEEIKAVAQRIISKSVNHVVVTDESGAIKGIVTSWDLTRAIAEGKTKLADIITKKVFTTRPEESLEAASRTLAQHHISALPVIDGDKKVVGLITSEDIAKLRGK